MQQPTDCLREILAGLLTACAAALLLAGCGGGGGGGGGAVSPSNRMPQISGAPPASIGVGLTYVFQPSAADQNGDDLRFSIANLPAWATFDVATGRLTGTPTAADAGTYSSIEIRVSDGISSTALASFSIAVNQIPTGQATVSWLPPTADTDGAALADLAGFLIYYGRDPGDLAEHITVSNPGLTSFMLENLDEGTWHFRLRAFTSDGAVSELSTIASKTIQ
jgi:hypothetical protein